MQVIGAAMLWGAGTALGEVPPYAISYHAAKAGIKNAEVEAMLGVGPAANGGSEGACGWQLDFWPVANRKSEGACVRVAARLSSPLGEHWKSIGRALGERGGEAPAGAQVPSPPLCCRKKGRKGGKGRKGSRQGKPPSFSSPHLPLLLLQARWRCWWRA